MPYNPPGSPLNYPTNDTDPVKVYKVNRVPTPNDSASFNVRDFWIDESSDDLYFLVNKSSSGAIWIRLGGTGGPTETLEGNSGGPVPPNVSNNIFTLGSAPLVVTGNPGTNTLTWSTDGTLATQYNADSGNAIPSGGQLNVLGGTGTSTLGSGNTITINTTGGGFSWQVDTTGPVSLVPHIGYIANGGAQIQYNLPATAAIGDVFALVAQTSNGFKIQAAAGQTITYGTQASSVAGALDSLNIGDVIFLLCVNTNTDFFVFNSIGNFILS